MQPSYRTPGSRYHLFSLISKLLALLPQIQGSGQPSSLKSGTLDPNPLPSDSRFRPHPLLPQTQESPHPIYLPSDSRTQTPAIFPQAQNPST